MSRYEVIYYPSYDPRESWLRAMLLLVDGITLIAPDDERHSAPTYIEKLSELAPGAIQRVAPSPGDIQLDNVNLRRLELALHQLLAQYEGVEERVITISPDGAISIEGRVFLHVSKLSQDVFDLLVPFQSSIDRLCGFCFAVTGHCVR